MAHSFEESKKIVNKTITILGIITVTEVFISLLAKGHIVEGLHLPMLLIGGLMIIFSAYKAFLIVYEFMHMKYEVPFLRRTVILPTLLLAWGLIAFLYDGAKWGSERESSKLLVNEATYEDNYSKKELKHLEHDHSNHSEEHHN